eukprot:GHVP01021391.1.p2 GENE.GHVP01021391.1~~GHVP01021391.1.p2  ORF type:complete len:254 (+),score=47.01 GHVP01021391.1:895-1656(+)
MDLIDFLTLAKNAEANTNFHVAPLVPVQEEVIGNLPAPTVAAQPGKPAETIAGKPLTKGFDPPSTLIFKGLSWAGYLVSVYFIVTVAQNVYSTLSAALDQEDPAGPQVGSKSAALLPGVQSKEAQNPKATGFNHYEGNKKTAPPATSQPHGPQPNNNNGQLTGPQFSSPVTGQPNQPQFNNNNNNDQQIGQPNEPNFIGQAAPPLTEAKTQEKTSTESSQSSSSSDKENPVDIVSDLTKSLKKGLESVVGFVA